LLHNIKVQLKVSWSALNKLTAGCYLSSLTDHSNGMASSATNPNLRIFMELNRISLKSATEDGLISEQQAELFWQFLSERAKNTPVFRFTHILYYLGGLIAIGAMSLFMTLGWERFGG
jgi:hypothetical protein